jgi:hypothetical protein
MTFPNGLIKEGYFEYNVYKGPKQMSQEGGNSPKNEMMKSLKAANSNNFYAGPNPNASLPKALLEGG